MKKKRILPLCLLLFVASFFYACHRADAPDPVNQVTESTIPKVLYNFKMEGVALPDGTRTVVDTHGSRVTLVYPEGIKYLKGGDYDTPLNRLDGGGSYTCTGECSDGCNVFYVQGSFACSQCKDGKACTGKASNGFTSEGGGFINAAAGIQFLSSRLEAKELARTKLQAPDNLFRYQAIRESLMSLNRRVHGVSDPTENVVQHPERYRHVAINVFGFITDYAVPVKFLEEETAKKNSARPQSSKLLSYQDVFVVAGENATSANGVASREAPDSDFSCNCLSGGAGCTAESGFGYKMCKSGNCDSCKMTVK
ncbi:hypothetical protein GCM10027594_17020 [Hymenobacter agri]